jgi:hypothetical protein
MLERDEAARRRQIMVDFEWRLVITLDAMRNIFSREEEYPPQQVLEEFVVHESLVFLLSNIQSIHFVASSSIRQGKVHHRWYSDRLETKNEWRNVVNKRIVLDGSSGNEKLLPRPPLSLALLIKRYTAVLFQMPF